MCENSLDAVSDRDFAIEFTAAAALVMTHLSRLSEELILWMSPRFGFIDLAGPLTAPGSSIMPQKKNPDVPELVRGKTGRVTGHLVALLTLMKGQPLAYNKDNQEDKEPLFDTVDTLAMTLRIYADMMRGVTVNAERMRAAALEGYSTATDLADYLVRKGVPVSGRSRGGRPRGAPRGRARLRPGGAESRGPAPSIRRSSRPTCSSVLTPEGSVASRNHIGGTAPAQVRAAIARARERLPSVRASEEIKAGESRPDLHG